MSQSINQMVKSTTRCIHICTFLFKSYLGLVSQVHFSSHGCNCQNESEMLFHISWLGNRREPVCTTPICRKLSKKLERSPFFFFLFPQWKEDRTKETERRKDVSYILNLQKQVLSTRIRAKWNAPCNTQSKDHKNVKGLERSNTETSHWSVLPAPTELSWWWGNAFIFRSFQEEEGWCPDTAINLGMLPALGTVILSVQLTWWEMLAWVKNSWCHFGNSSRKLKF